MSALESESDYSSNITDFDGSSDSSCDPELTSKSIFFVKKFYFLKL